MASGSAACDDGETEPFCSTPRWIMSSGMKQFPAIVHRGEPAEGGFWATCLEVPGANGQGETKEECLGNLKQAIQLLLDTEREEVFRLDPQAETTELVLA
jgi:predicted RNase H-like HicB family nuclease